MTTLNPAATMTDIMATLRPADPPRPREARRITTEPDEPITDREAAMPSGVYERKKRDKAEGGVAAPKKRKYTRRANGAAADDPKQLAQEALVAAGEHLYATVQDEVEVGDNATLKAALRGFEVAQKISKAVG